MAANESHLLTAEFASDASLLTPRFAAGDWPSTVRFPGQAGIPQMLPAGNRTPAYLAVKRLLDIVGAVGLLALLSPLLAATWAVLMWTTRGKPFFWQDG